MLMEAYTDLKYLLNRGYLKAYALEFVANHYRLPKKERYLLARCVFPDSWIAEVKEKLLKPKELAGKTLAIDGFNVLITLESILEGEAILCEDGLVRDLKYQGKYRLNAETERLLGGISKALRELEVEKAIFFYGKNVPKSGAVKALTEETLQDFGVYGEVELVKSPDFELKRFKTVATADTAVVAKAEGVFDLPGYVGEKLGRKPVSFIELLRETKSPRT
jgi:hypothetical protein